jgi:hypothetical protein
MKMNIQTLGVVEVVVVVADQEIQAVKEIAEEEEEML